MSGAPLPPVIPEPFAKNADPSFIQNPIPQTTGVPGRASYDLGFPPLSMQPIAAGGKPPFGQDFNGLLFAITSQQYFAQAGQLWPYNATVAAAIGGYGVGSILSSVDGKTIWINTSNGNVTDPDSGGAAGWVSMFTYGFQEFNGLTGGTVTATPAQARFEAIILNGTLTSNLALVLPPQFRQWLIINNTGGAATVTVRTSGGTGVIVPPGGFSSPVGVYGDGTNIYPTVPAASLIPADQNANPLTLAERTNTSDILASRFNMSFGVDNTATTNVIYDNGDGYLRRKTLANFEASMALSAMGGAVSTGQVPQGAVTQFTPAILANATLTGVPTAPTPAAGASNGQVPNTAWVNPFSILALPGALRLPSGHLVCYGPANPNGGGVTVTLPGGLSYTSSATYAILALSISGGSVGTWVQTGSQTANSFSLHNTGGSAYWFTIGF